MWKRCVPLRRVGNGGAIGKEFPQEGQYELTSKVSRILVQRERKEHSRWREEV